MMQARGWIFAGMMLALGAGGSLLGAADGVPVESAGAGRLPALASTWEPGANGGRRATIVMDETSTAEALVTGKLLVPFEEAPAARRPDLLFACHGGHLHIFDTARHVEITKPQVRDFTGLAAEEGIALPEDSPAVLLGCAGDVAVILQSRAVVGIDLKKCAIAWQVPLAPWPALEVGSDHLPPYAAMLAAHDFPICRLIGGKLMIVEDGKLSATDIATGKTVWTDAAGNPIKITLPEGKSSISCGNEKYIIIRTYPLVQDGVRFTAIDATAQKPVREFSVAHGENPRALLSPNTLYIVSQKTVTAYDLAGGDEKPRWRREDIPSQFPGAAVLFPDGIVVVKNQNELLHLSQKDGQNLPVPGGATVYLQNAISSDQPGFLDSLMCDDVVYFQSAADLEAYDLSGKVAGLFLWKTPQAQPGENPPMQDVQLSDHFVVALEAGPCKGARNMVNLKIYTRSGGKLVLRKVLQRNASTEEGPPIAAWQVVDGGIAMESRDAIYLYRVKVP